MAKVIADYTSASTVATIAWSTAASSCALMGYLRVRAGKHFFTDVLTGYIVGAAMGITIPQLHKHGEDKKTPLTPYWDGASQGLVLGIKL